MTSVLGMCGGTVQVCIENTKRWDAYYGVHSSKVEHHTLWDGPQQEKDGCKKKLDTYRPHIENLGRNSSKRIDDNINYQNFLKEIKQKDKDIEDQEEEKFGSNDLQLVETYNIVKDLILLMMMHDTDHEITGS